MRAKAAVLYEAGTPLRIEEVEVLPPQRGEVQVRMYAGGVCHSDLHVMKGDLYMPTPVILGHEGSGIVEQVGEGVTSVQPGDHVIPIWRVSCGACEYCTGGRPALCDVGTQVRVTGLMPDGTTRFRINGTPVRHFAGVSTFSQLSTMPEAAVLKIPQDFPLDKAALLGCGVITGVGAVVNAAKVRMGSSVAVFGCGGIGLNAIQGARIVGALTIIGVDVVDRKLEYARKLGATHTINAAQQDPVEAIKELTGGKGVDYAFEAIGLPKTIEQAYAATRKMGLCVVIGVTRADVRVGINANEMVYAEKTLMGSLYGSSRPKIDLLKLIDMYRSGKLLLDELLTRTYPLEQINEAYAALERGEVARSLVLA
ncbi:MAG: S-(hydroxymethyl)glutathione dehydrogenase [Candidatus Tectimicrobiota bacterium]|nr:MAG: S-(hydroxymethyl)glutathione dehydrogenase [Candidatus Tectomicrobia bacterium]